MTEPKQPVAPTEADRPATQVDDASQPSPETVGSSEPVEPVETGAASADLREGAARADDDRPGADERTADDADADDADADDADADDADADDAGAGDGAIDTRTMTDTAMTRGGTVGHVQVRRRFGRTTQPAAAPTVSEVAVKIRDRASQVYVGVVVVIFAAILLNALFLGHGGLFAPKPTASPSPSVSAAPASAGPSASGAPASGAPASAGPSVSASP